MRYLIKIRTWSRRLWRNRRALGRTLFCFLIVINQVLDIVVSMKDLL